MVVILKHTFRNIFAKPLMTIFLVISITICAFAGMLAFDMSNSLENILGSAFGTMFGTANVVVETSTEISEKDFEGLPDYKATFLSVKSSKVMVRNDQMYAYYNEKNLTTTGVDTKIAAEMRLIPKNVQLDENECIITKVMAKELKLKEGDTFTIYGDNYVAVDYKIKKISSLSGLLIEDYSAIVSQEGMAKLCYDKTPKYQLVYIKVADEAKLGEFCDTLEERYPNIFVENLINGKTIRDQINQISGVFMVLFLITLLLVIFVTVSLSERIMVDRMSTVGTLRSLGVSPNLTARVILVENMFYGLFGGVIGTSLYAISRDIIFNSVFTLNSGGDIDLAMDLGKVSIPVMISVIAGAVLVEMLCPLRELLKATNTAIRDLIFDNKDTEYKYKKKNKIISLVCAGLAVIMIILGVAVFDESPAPYIVAFVLIVLSVFSGYSFILKGVLNIFERMKHKKDHPIMELAMMNLRTKKTSIGSSKLVFIATSLSLVLFIGVTSLQYYLNIPPADADVFLQGFSEKAESYDYISSLEGVKNIEFEYSTQDRVLVGKEKIEDYLEHKYDKKFEDDLTIVPILGADGAPELNTGYQGIPDEIKSDEVYLAKKIAKELNLSVGDTADILYNPEGVVPFRGTFKVAGIIDSSKGDGTNKTIVLPLDVYKQIYFDRPSCAYIQSDHPGQTVELIKSYSSSTVNKIEKMDDYMKENKENSAGMLTMLYLIIIMGVSLSLVGVFCNQIVGFESRKRECAVLLSTSMDKGRLVKLFWNETALSGFISILLGAIVGLMETILIFQAMKDSIAIEPIFNAGKILTFLLLIFFTFSITIGKTIRNINRMNVAEQLKYE